MEEEEEGGGGFEQFPAPFVDPLRPVRPLSSFRLFLKGNERNLQSLCPQLPPLKHEYDPEAIKTWIYPINLPLRDYQLSIVSKCLYQNTLVALPTGLGKTFIAGVMMLNYSRWFPTGKIIFIAPTRPLVSQQAQAFPETCGFLNSKVTTLMGGVNPAKRQAEYPKKTVFFMTAQTLANDISKGLLDAKEIILLVVDEAHKATGNQAYCQVVSLIQARNHNFRILALTATPSGKVEGVQALIDSLHISHIEIRDEGSIDIVKYVHKKHTELILVKMTPNIIQLKDMMVELMMPMMKPLIQNGILRDNENDPSLIHCFRLHSLRNDLQRKKNFRWNSCLMQLEGFARALGYLLEHSVNMFSSSLTNALTKKDSATSKNKQINEILRTVEDMKTVGGFVAHAKMDRTKGLLLEHFAEREEGDGKGDLDPASTRVMVFCSFRECVNELVGCLNEEAPLLKAKAFVGQSKDTSGKAGLTQKAQIQIIKDFKEGKFNILVATQIGEEGLDIGAVDKIICYDAQKSSIRMLQRVGRTGRKRDGAITVLMGEGREEKSWDSAKESYESVQDLITRGAHLELYDDVPRLLPAHAKPVLVKKVVPIDTTPVEEDKPEKKVRKPRVSGAAAAKVERGTPIPKGATTGFVTARALKKKHIPTELEDDSDDAAIQAGPSFMARVNSAPSAGGSKAKGKGKGKARQMDSDDDDEEEEEEKSSRVPKRAKTTSAIPDKKRRVEEVEDDDGEDDEIKFQGFHRPQVPSRMRKDISSSPEGPPLRPAKKSAVVPPPKKPKVNPTPLFELPSSPPPSPPPNPPPKRAPQPPPISKARMAQPPPPPPPSKILQPPPPPKRIVAPAPPPP
ncbi:P-loop containing nucleoside triphosphate hydrolase protein, partial [Mrakia frigida]|uniref:3'-5' DNA helicase n=1 Tax=Mrakia frigida TaxID=29902 RepID=UPI003FCBF716